MNPHRPEPASSRREDRPDPPAASSSAGSRPRGPQQPEGSAAGAGGPPLGSPAEIWESRLALELRSLPDRRAPRTLIPRVMAALQASARVPWYRRPWWQWPSALQVVSLAGLSALLGLATWLVMHAGQIEWTAILGAEIRSCLAPLTPLWSLVTALAGAVASVARGLSGWLLLAGSAFCIVMYLSCVGLGTAFYRVVRCRRNS